MIQAREIPRSEWKEFLLSFSEQYDEEPVAVEITGHRNRTTMEDRDFYLRRISQVHQASESALAVMLNSSDGRHLTHMVTSPVRLWLQHSTTNNRDVLEIQSADGTTTLVRPGTRAEQPRRVERFPRKGDDEDISE